MTKEIIEVNKLIAEFMGYTKCPPEQHVNHSLLLVNPNTKQYTSFDELKYHSSWDWQIPAWSKLISLCQKMVAAKKDMTAFESARDEYYKLLDKYEQAVCTNNTGVGFVILTQTLKWYNENNKSHQSHTEK